MPAGAFIDFGVSARGDIITSSDAVASDAATTRVGDDFQAGVGVKVATFALISCHEEGEHAVTIIMLIHTMSNATPHPIHRCLSTITLSPQITTRSALNCVWLRMTG
jgi:hypothetical protein